MSANSLVANLQHVAEIFAAACRWCNMMQKFKSCDSSYSYHNASHQGTLRLAVTYVEITLLLCFGLLDPCCATGLTQVYSFVPCTMIRSVVLCVNKLTQSKITKQAWQA